MDISKCRSLLILISVCLLSAGPVWAQAKESNDLKKIRLDLDISGEAPDVEYTVPDPTFKIEFNTKIRDIAYKGKVLGAVVESKEPGTLTLWFALRQLHVTHGKTSVAGWPGSADCGPMMLKMGDKKNLWMAFDLVRVKRDGRDLITLKGTRFQLPDENWEIGQPEWVKVTGALMTEDRVKDGLSAGLRENRKILEKQIVGMGRKVLKDLILTISNDHAGKRELMKEVEKRLQVSVARSIDEQK